MEQTKNEQSQTADDTSGHDPEPDEAELDIAAEMEALRAERDEAKDRLMRTFADLENTRKRADRDKRDAEQAGAASVARDMLPVFDNLKRALDAVPDDERENQKALIDGLELTVRDLLNVLDRHGIRQLSPEIGEVFDPNLHQAMFEAPVPGTPAGKVIQVMNDGFLHHERLLRPAQVGVSAAPPDDQGPSSNDLSS